MSRWILQKSMSGYCKSQRVDTASQWVDTASQQTKQSMTQTTNYAVVNSQTVTRWINTHRYTVRVLLPDLLSLCLPFLEWMLLFVLELHDLAYCDCVVSLINSRFKWNESKSTGIGTQRGFLTIRVLMTVSQAWSEGNLVVEVKGIWLWEWREKGRFQPSVNGRDGNAIGSGWGRRREQTLSCCFPSPSTSSLQYASETSPRHSQTSLKCTKISLAYSC